MKVPFAAAVVCWVIAAPASAGEMVVKRAGYTIKVPEKSTIDAEDEDIDLDHMTTINLPNDTSLMIMVVDDKNDGETIFETMVKGFKDKCKDAKEGESNIVRHRKGKGVSIRGKFNGAKMCFDTGLFKGKQKAFVVTSICLESERKETMLIVDKALKSFVIIE